MLSRRLFVFCDDKDVVKEKHICIYRLCRFCKIEEQNDKKKSGKKQANCALASGEILSTSVTLAIFSNIYIKEVARWR